MSELATDSRSSYLRPQHHQQLRQSPLAPDRPSVPLHQRSQLPSRPSELPSWRLTQQGLPLQHSCQPSWQTALYDDHLKLNKPCP